MLPDVFLLLANADEVTSLIGDSPVRAYRHGAAPQRVTLPYVTWFVGSANPANSLDGVPSVDEYTVQIDCWSEADEQVECLAEAVRDAIEPEHYMISIGPNGRDPETMRYRVSMTFTFWTDRP